MIFRYCVVSNGFDKMKNEAFLCLFFTFVCAEGFSAEKKSNPNVIFIYADDMGRGMLSYYGQKYISTPNIDRLFSEGTCFSNAYGCMFSAPARASLLTGYPDVRIDKWHKSNGGQLFQANTYDKLEQIERKIDEKRVKLPVGDLYLPQVFKKAGYITGQIGKLEWGSTTTRKEMREHGWDYYYGFLDHNRCHGYYPPFLFENDSIIFIKGNTHVDCAKTYESETPENYQKRWNMTGKTVYSQNLFLHKIIEFIHAHRNEPFFLFHSTTLPHGPVSIPAVHLEVKNNPELTEIEKEYASMVKMLDEHIGIIFDELEKLNLLDNTLIVFSVDNGHEIYYQNGNRCRKGPVRDMYGNAFDSWNYPFRSELAGDYFDGNNGMSGKKWSNLEGGVRVPLVFRWPSKIKMDRIVEQVVANYDLLPTFAEMLNVKLPIPKDGESLMPILFGLQDTLPIKRYVYIDSYEGPCIIDSDGWKLIYNKQYKEFRLFFLPDDYKEEKDLSRKYPMIVVNLKKQLEKELSLIDR